MCCVPGCFTNDKRNPDLYSVVYKLHSVLLLLVDNSLV